MRFYTLRSVFHKAVSMNTVRCHREPHIVMNVRATARGVAPVIRFGVSHSWATLTGHYHTVMLKRRQATLEVIGETDWATGNVRLTFKSSAPGTTVATKTIVLRAEDPETRFDMFAWVAMSGINGSVEIEKLQCSKDTHVWPNLETQAC